MSSSRDMQGQRVSSIRILGQRPGDEGIVHEANERGQEFERYMRKRGLNIYRDQYKIMTRWADQEYFSKSVEEHVQDFIEATAEASKNVERQTIQARQDSLMRTICSKLSRWKYDSTVPVVLPAHEEDYMSHNAVDLDLLDRILPEHERMTMERAVDDEQTSTLYDALPVPRWIRLLILEPKSNPRFQCYMRAVKLEDAMGKYEAVSYCWEGLKNSNVDHNVDDRESITCNGLPIKLKQNLYSALREIRFRKRHRILWVDAVCIDQTNAEERSSQVQIMGDIYRNASRVIIWLGNIEPKVSAVAFDAVCQLIDNWDTTYRASYHARARASQGNQSLPHSKSYHFQCSDLVPIFKADWFERRWVLQEAALAREAIVVVPDASIPWKWIVVASGILRTKHLEDIKTHGIHTNVCNAYLMARLSDNTALPALQPNLLHLLRLATEFKAKKDLDTVFALLSLAPIAEQAQKPLIPVSYHQSLEDLMRHTTKHLSSLPQPLSFLSDAGVAWRGADCKWPSWLPQYGQKDYVMLDPWALDGPAFSPTSTLPFRRWPWPTEDKPELVVESINFSPVVKKMPISFDSGQLNRTVEHLFSLLRSFNSDIDDFEKLSVLSHTLTGGRDSYGQRNRNRFDHARDFADFLFAWQQSFGIDSGLVGSVDLQNLDRSGQFKRFMEVAPMVCDRRSIFVTASGYIGLGPEALEAGDLVHAIVGATMLHLLRRDPAGYKLVGDCFMDGLMDGEIVAMLDSVAPSRGPFSTLGSDEPTDQNRLEIRQIMLI